MDAAELNAIRERLEHDWFNCFRGDGPPGVDTGADVKADVLALLAEVKQLNYIAVGVENAAREENGKLAAEVKRLRAELASHHCNSCDGSAPECRKPAGYSFNVGNDSIKFRAGG